jgi:hypothetical protein
LPEAIRAVTDFNLASFSAELRIAFAKHGFDQEDLVKYIDYLAALQPIEQDVKFFFELLSTPPEEVSADVRTTAHTYNWSWKLKDTMPSITIDQIRSALYPSSGLEETIRVRAKKQIETFVQTWQPPTDAGRIPLMISAGLEERYPALAGLEELEERGIYRQSGRSVASTITQLIGLDVRNFTLAGLESEVPLFQRLARRAGMVMQTLLPSANELRLVILTILAAYSGQDPTIIGGSQEFELFMAALAALSPST